MTKTFFATDADIAVVWRSIFDVPGMKIFEEYSVPDQPNRWFATWSDIAAALRASRCSLAAWFEPAGGMPRIEHITFDAATQRRLKAAGRTALFGPATIRINRIDDQNGWLAASSMTVWTEKGVRQRSLFPVEIIEQVDWKQLRSTVARIERFIVKIAPAKMRSFPVLPDAFALLKSGDIRLWNWGEPCGYDSPLVVEA